MNNYLIQLNQKIEYVLIREMMHWIDQKNDYRRKIRNVRDSFENKYYKFFIVGYRLDFE